MTKRIHFADAVIKHVEPRAQTNKDNFKPKGLWYSIEGNGDGWSDWCKSENFEDTTQQVAHELHINTNDILCISTPEELDAFTKQFAYDPYKNARLKILRYIDWTRVANLWPGIEITPYLWSCRLDNRYFWYYSWDCASGCIWMPSDCDLKIVNVRRPIVCTG